MRDSLLEGRSGWCWRRAKTIEMVTANYACVSTRGADKVARMNGFLKPSSAPATTQPLMLMLIVAIGLLVGCQPPPVVPHRGPIVLITIDTLRADVVGALAGPATPLDQTRLTPNLDRFAAESDWATRAVSTSSWTVPSMASLMTGQQPWRHGNWHGERAALQESHRTLAEALKEGGYQTAGFRSNTWLRGSFGYAQGFDQFKGLRGGKRAASLLESLAAEQAEANGDDAPNFVWIHILPPHAPYQLHRKYLDRLGDAGPNVEGGNWDALPNRVNTGELEQYLDPGRTPAPELLAQYWALYRLHVSHADQVVGELLDALRRSDGWEDSLVAITSDHGEEFGEADQITHGGNLHRALIEVPLLVKLPKTLREQAHPARSFVPRAGVSNARLFATVLEAIGAEPGAHTLDSLFVDREPAALSELYLGNGVNRFSLVRAAPDGALEQIHWQSQFGPSEPEYFSARKAALKAGLLPSGEAPEEIFGRQALAFLQAPPLAGALERPAVEIRSWSGATRSTPVVSGALAQASRQLEQRWVVLNGEDLSPAHLAEATGEEGRARIQLSDEERERLRALGYVVN